jgi:RNA polymerase sigma-70 factor (ECF subfamily)
MKKELDDLNLARARRGEADACRALVRRYQGPVFAILSRMLRPAGRACDIEDLAQETFLRVFRSLARFNPRGPARLSTWILTIASRLAVDTLRRRRPRLVDSSATAAVPDETVERRHLRAILEEALAGLAPEQRAFFLLHSYHGFTLQEIAGAFDVELGTVKSRISRARAALRKALQEVHHDGQI